MAPAVFFTLFFCILQLSTLFTHATTIDLTAANRRPPISGLPDWSKVGFMEGKESLPDDSRVTRIITPEMLASQYNVIPNDGIDDTDGLQKAIEDAGLTPQAPNYTLLQLPAGVINLSYTVFLSTTHLILRGAGNDPDNGGTKIVLTPNQNMIYDVLTPGGDQWDLDGMSFSWDLPTGDCPGGLGEHCGRYIGSASSGWIWPGRSIFRIGSKRIAPKFQRAASIAPSNRLDLFYGTVNYHWRIDQGSVKGFMASQVRDFAGYKGDSRVFIHNATEYPWINGTQVWIASPVRYNDYVKWGVTTESYFVNSYVYQDWFTVVGKGNDTENGPYLDLDRPLRFDVYANSASDGSPVMEKTIAYAKIMPIDDPVDHVGVENLYLTQPIEGMNPADAERNYGNLAPDRAMHGIVFRYAKNCWVRNIRTFMTGSHPIATEAAKNIQVQDSYFDGAWNKGKGGNGYLRGSRVWDSLYFNLTQRNLRHFTFQWCSMGNVASFLNVTNDLNMHGGYESYNLLELNYVAPAYSHRSGSCTAHCGGEGGSSEGGTWWPIYWSTGEKASKWSGSTGPQNIFYRNYMIKQPEPNVDYVEYNPYFARDGSTKETIWQFGWDRISSFGERFQHLSLDSCAEGSCLLQDWQDNEKVSYYKDPQLGINGRRDDTHTSLFLRDVTNATDGVSKFSSIAGYAYCRGKVQPKMVGYYLATASGNSCSEFLPDFVDWSAYTHILFAYGNLASDGTVSVPAGSVANLQAIAALKSENPNLKVYLAIGGYGLGADSTAIKAIANSASARTKFGTTAKTVLATYGLDGIDVEWASPITANQFSNIATAIKTGLGTSYNLTLSTPVEFWQLSGLNKVTIAMSSAVEFVSLITHSYAASDDSPNTPANIQVTLKAAQTAGFPPEQTLMGIPFYGRSLGTSHTSTCLAAGALGQQTFPYYAIDSILNEGRFDQDYYETYQTDPKSFTEYLTLSDGTVLIYDSAPAVTYKVGLSTDLCMGGVSVFSIDQDDEAYTLTNALWDVGGIIEPAAEIARALSTNVLGHDGLVNEDYLNTVSDALATKYPFLSMISSYRILLHSALSAEAQVANQIRNYLSNTLLAGDGFALYKKWETKAMNWAIANATALGNEYWECAINQDQDKEIPESAWSQSHCAAGIDKPPEDEFVYNMNWRLKDAAGFADYMNQTLGLNTSSLIPGSILVNQDPLACIVVTPLRADGEFNIPPTISENATITVNHTSVYIGIDDGTGRIVSPSTTPPLQKRDQPDPYDADPDCNYKWIGILSIDQSTFFSDPLQGIKDFLDYHDSFMAAAYGAVEAPWTTSYQLMTLLESALTNIAQGNSALNNTQAYVEQVKYDQALQAQSDAWYKARDAAFGIFIDIALTILGFLPGLQGLEAIVIARGAKLLSSISDAIRAGRIAADGIAADVKIIRAFEGGFATTDRIADASKVVESLMAKRTLATRGKLSSPVEKVNNRLLECAEGGIDFLLDAADMATALIPDVLPAAKRSLLLTEANVSRTPSHTQLRRHHGSLAISSVLQGTVKRREEFSMPEIRSKPDDCIWEMKEAADLKGFGYGKHCLTDTFPISFPGKSGGYVTDTYANCKDKSKGLPANVDNCQCDHLFEAIEVLETLKPSSLTDDDIKALCAEFPDVSRQLRTEMNGKNNMRGLSQRANTFKTNLLSEAGYKAQTHDGKDALNHNSLKDGFAKVELQNLEDYQKRNVLNRQTVATTMDTITDALDPQTPGAKAAWAKIYTAGMFEARRKVGDDRVTSKLPALKEKAKDGTGPVQAKKRKKPASTTKDGTGKAKCSKTK
ncbi:hypothetical protein Hypma_005536 [Hypsizygus marmoreus]|uniref:GH18 domain-containing protein n=1 Tax=Hypsizygus marmoreus TaxID=39966 RepID=A0A369JWD9_HYPMA|nr:hypothetical protein Hypma_005536 [Hypsizygus marmoreus]